MPACGRTSPVVLTGTYLSEDRGTWSVDAQLPEKIGDCREHRSSESSWRGTEGCVQLRVKLSGWRVELGHQAFERGGELRIVLLRMGAYELDDFALPVRGLLPIRLLQSAGSISRKDRKSCTCRT
jgi:hypothetical protein